MSVVAEWPRPSDPPQWRPAGPEPGAPPVDPGQRLPAVMTPVGPLDPDLAARLVDRRIVVVNGYLDRTAAAGVVAQLLVLDGADARPIALHLATDDAELAAATDVADTFDLLRAPVHATAVGVVGGAALAILAAASDRAAHPQAVFVLREPPVSRPAGHLDGGTTSPADAAELARRQVSRLRERLAAATQRPVDEIAVDLAAGRVLGADEALAYGLVTRLAGRDATTG